MSNFLLAFVKLQEYFESFPNIGDRIAILQCLFDLSTGKSNEANPFYTDDALKIRSSLPFKELSLQIEQLVYRTYAKYLKIS